MKLPFHKHRWDTIYQIGFKVVQQCLCGDLQSSVYDFTEKAYVWREGNLHYDDNLSVIWIAAETQEDYIEAKKIILQTNPRLPEKMIYWLSDPQVVVKGSKVSSKSPIYFYGQWWLREEYNKQAMTMILNRLAGGE